MRYVKTVQLGDYQVVVRELTVGELRAWLKSSQISKPDEDDVLGGWLFTSLTLNEIPIFTDLTADKLEALTPSALSLLIDGIKEVNAVFFDRVAQLNPATQPRAV